MIRMFPALYPALYEHFSFLMPYKHVGKHNCVIWQLQDCVYICFKDDLCKLKPDKILISPTPPHARQPDKCYDIGSLEIIPYPNTPDGKVIKRIMKVYLASMAHTQIIDRKRATMAITLYKRYFIDVD